jgi:hypothetical protein
MSDKPKASGVCLDLEFYIDEYWKFIVPDLDGTYDSYAKMREGIERSHKKIVAAKKRKLNIVAVDESSRRFTVTGVHSGHGKLITSPAQERFSRSRRLYFDTPLVAAALAEKRRLGFDLSKVDALLDKHEVKSYDGYSFKPEMHDAAVRRIEKAQAETEKIRDKPLMEALAGIKATPVEFG